MLCGLLLCVRTVAQSSAGGNPVSKPPILGQVSREQALESHRHWSVGSLVGKALGVREGTEQDRAERSFSGPRLIPVTTKGQPASWASSGVGVAAQNCPQWRQCGQSLVCADLGR